MNTKTLLLVIALILAGILGALVYQSNQKPQTTGEKLEAAIDSAADDLGEGLEDVGEEIQRAVPQR